MTTPPIDIRQEQNDDDGSDVGGIVTGCVVTFILIIVIVLCLVIFLIWYTYRAKKKRDHTTTSGLCNMYNYIDNIKTNTCSQIIFSVFKVCFILIVTNI